MSDRTVFIKILLISFSCIATGIFIPGIVMYHAHSFSKEDIIKRLPESDRRRVDQEARVKINFEKRKQSLLNRISDTSKIVEASVFANTVDSTLKFEKLESETLQKSVVLAPYYPDNQLLILFPLSYFGLALILALITPRMNVIVKAKDFILMIGLLEIFLRWPTWIRNTPIGNIDRKVYSVVNFDISRLGFFVQEIQVLVFVIMLARICCNFFSYSEYLNKLVSKSSYHTPEGIYNMYRLVKSEHEKFQVCSCFLAISFGFYTYYFWSLIKSTMDYRYLPHAIVLHVLWLLIWFVIASPSFISRKAYEELEETINVSKIKDPAGKNQHEALNYLQLNDPVSKQNQTLTSIISIATFLLPIFKLIF